MNAAVAYRHKDPEVCTPRGYGSRASERVSFAELVILAVALATLFAAAALPSVDVGIDTPIHTQTVAVRTSQSLWDLARAYPQDGRSAAQTVEVIRRLNDLEQSALTPGQLLQVPAQTTVFAADAQL